jgi:hypothetical protein
MVMSEVHAHAPSYAKHTEKADLELYVINALAMDQAAEVEDHVAHCEACAELLAREAQLELAMDLLAERAEAKNVATVVRLAPRKVARVAGGLAGALAAAAALVLWLTPATKADDDVARYGAVTADASGSMVSLEAAPSMDKLDGG